MLIEIYIVRKLYSYKKFFLLDRRSQGYQKFIRRTKSLCNIR